MIDYVDIIIDGISYFFITATMLYCVDGAIKALKKYYKNKKEKT